MYSDLRKAQLLARLFSNASLYGLGTLLTRTGGLLLLPLYWLKLSPGDFGVVGLSQALMVFLTPVLGLGLNDAMQRFYYDWPEEQRPYRLAALWLSSSLFGLLLCLVLDALGTRLFSHLVTQVSFDPFLRMALWSAFAVNVSLIPLTLLRVRERVAQFTLVTVLSFLLQSSLCLVFLFALDMGVKGYLLASLINAAVWALYTVCLMLGAIRLPFSWASMGESVRYALPLVPATVLEGLASVLDRMVLDKFVPLAQIGLYNLGNQFGSAVNVFNQILKAAWIPFVFRATTERADGPAVLGKFSVYYIAALCVPALGVALLSKEFILLLGDTRYHGVYDFVPVFVLVCLVQGAGTALGRGIDIAKKTSWGIVVPAVSVVAGLVALWFLVPAFGVWGAVGAALITAVLRIGTHISLALHFYPRPLHVKSLLSICVITLTAFFFGYSVDTGSLLFDASLKLLLIAAAAGTIFWFALDRQQGLSLLRKWAGSN